MVMGDQSRAALKAEREKQKKASKNKKARRKYRKLEDAKEVESPDDQTNGVRDQNDHETRDTEVQLDSVQAPTQDAAQSHPKP